MQDTNNTPPTGTSPEAPEIVTGTITATDITPEEQPISQWDWFKLSRSWIFGYEDRLKSQVDSIQSAVKWFFTLGSTATILGVSFGGAKLQQVNAWMFGVALLLLLVSFALATLSVTLASRSMDNPDSAGDIREAFNSANITSRIMIVISSVFLVGGMALFPLAVALSFQKPPAPLPPEPRFTAVSLGTNDAKTGRTVTGIDISGFTPNSSQLNLRLSSGKSLLASVAVDSFRHTLQHAKFDLVWPLTKPYKQGKANLYLTLIYKNGPDTLASQSVKLTP